MDRARQSEVLIYAIGLLNEEERREAKSAKRALNALTHESGGLSFYPKGVAEVDAIALQVAHEIRNQYTIAYSPLIDAVDGSFRQIKVTVTAPGHPQVRTRTGYYATPDPASKKDREFQPLMQVSCGGRREDIACARGAAPICAGAWRPIGARPPPGSSSPISGASPGATAGICYASCAGRRG